MDPLRDTHQSNMFFCLLAAKRSKDPCTQVGACVVDRQGNLLGLGYNGMPIGCSDDEFPWCKGSKQTLQNKHHYVCHAEMNAIVNAMKPLDDCKIYTTLFPCNECAKLIIQCGIKEVVYLSDKHSRTIKTEASKLMFDKAGVKYGEMKLRKNIKIKFDDIDDRSLGPSDLSSNVIIYEE